MAKALPIVEDGKPVGHMIYCPACKCGHAFYNTSANKGSNWTFDGNTESPTFSPSMLVFKDIPAKRCHSFVRNGKIEYLQDCGHSMAGQTVDLEEF